MPGLCRPLGRGVQRRRAASRRRCRTRLPTKWGGFQKAGILSTYSGRYWEKKYGKPLCVGSWHLWYAHMQSGAGAPATPQGGTGFPSSRSATRGLRYVATQILCRRTGRQASCMGRDGKLSRPSSRFGRAWQQRWTSYSSTIAAKH